MTKIKGKTVLVTGGASGIGKLMGESCLKEGASKLIIWDINKEAMLATVKEFRAKGHEVHAYQVDVSDMADIDSAAYTVLEDIGYVDIFLFFLLVYEPRLMISVFAFEKFPSKILTH